MTKEPTAQNIYPRWTISCVHHLVMKTPPISKRWNGVIYNQHTILYWVKSKHVEWKWCSGKAPLDQGFWNPILKDQLQRLKIKRHKSSRLFRLSMQKITRRQVGTYECIIYLVDQQIWLDSGLQECFDTPNLWSGFSNYNHPLYWHWKRKNRF